MDKCSVSGFPQSVYGFAVHVEDNEKEAMFNKLVKSNPYATKTIKSKSIIASSPEEWTPLGESKYYPLYWGISEWLLCRVNSHTKSNIGVGSLWLNKNKALKGRTVIFGAILCNYEDKVEKSLQNLYKQVLKTHTKQKT